MRIAIDENGIGFAMDTGMFIPIQYFHAFFDGELYEYYDYEFSVIEDRRMKRGENIPIFVRTIGGKAILESNDTPKF